MAIWNINEKFYHFCHLQKYYNKRFEWTCVFLFWKVVYISFALSGTFFHYSSNTRDDKPLARTIGEVILNSYLLYFQMRNDDITRNVFYTVQSSKFDLGSKKFSSRIAGQKEANRTRSRPALGGSIPLVLVKKISSYVST